MHFWKLLQVVMESKLPSPYYSDHCVELFIGYVHGGVTGFLGSLKISSCEEGRLKDTQNLKCEDRRFQYCLILKIEDFDDSAS